MTKDQDFDGRLEWLFTCERGGHGPFHRLDPARELRAPRIVQGRQAGEGHGGDRAAALLNSADHLLLTYRQGLGRKDAGLEQEREGLRDLTTGSSFAFTLMSGEMWSPPKHRAKAVQPSCKSVAPVNRRP